METIIDELLTDHTKQENAGKVLLKHTKHVHESVNNHGINTRLFPTSSSFLQLYENDMNRLLDQAQSLSSPNVDINSLQRRWLNPKTSVWEMN